MGLPSGPLPHLFPAPVLPSWPWSLLAPSGAELSPKARVSGSHLACFPFRIVAARLNGSLDFFSLETHAAFSPLQFRGQWSGLGRCCI